MLNKFKFIFKYFLVLCILVVFVNACINLFIMRNQIFNRAHQFVLNLSDFVNPTNNQGRPIPGKVYTDIQIADNADNIGMWTGAFDWPVMSLHAALLPDATVLTFGSYAVVEKEKNKSLGENKKIKISNNNYNYHKNTHFDLKRDNGDYQYGGHHPVNGGVDFDIWNPKLGIADESHKTYFRPVVHDAFCSVVRVLDDRNVLISGGNTEPRAGAEDTKRKNTVYNLIEKKFLPIAELKHPRWYGSIARLSNNNFVMVGGIGEKASIIPELLEKDVNGKFVWRELHGAKSEDLFGQKSNVLNKELKNNNEAYNDEDYKFYGDEWYYPKAFTVSDGSVVGISYDKLWRLDTSGNGNIIQTGKIITKPILSKPRVHYFKNNIGEKSTLIIGEKGAGIGFSSSAVMIEKDKVYTFGGQQVNYLPSDDIHFIDFSDSYNPKIKKVGLMKNPRMNANTVILPNGNIFIHGGTSLNNTEFSILNPEIFNPKTNRVDEIENPSLFRRNYHSTLLLLPDATILAMGGDTWNAEIYYPSYLFEKNKSNKIVFRDRPKIEKIEKNIFNRMNINLETNEAENIERITLISTGSVTHSQGSEPKFFDLKFRKLSTTNILFDIDQNKNIIQDGSYLLFLINKNGTPSVGKIIVLN